MTTLRLHHVSLLVADTDASLRFFHGLLGLPIIDRPDLGFPGAWLGVGEQQIHLLELPNPDPTSGRPAHGGRDRHTAFLVEDLTDIEARLVVQGVPYTRSRSGRAAIFCRDPDGNGIELIAAPAGNQAK